MFKVPRAKIILDCLGVRLGEQRGAERYICGIITELASRQNTDYLLLINESCLEFVRGLVPQDQYLLIPISGKNRVFRMLVQMLIGPIIARHSGAALYTSSSVFPTLGFPCPTAAVVHDLMLYHFPHEYRRTTWIIRTLLLKASLARLAAVFTVSETAAKDIRARYRKHALSVYIVPGGTSQTTISYGVHPERERSILEELQLQDRQFVLSVLGGGKYKNQYGLAKAADELQESGRNDIDVIVVGDAIRILRTIRHSARLRALGFVRDEVLAVLYANASALIYPTLFEGFGLPVIEAQVAGLPVVCSNLEVLKEIAGAGALFVDPHDSGSIARAIVNVLDSQDLQNRLIALGRENAARFTWQKSVDRFLEACQSVTTGMDLGEVVRTSV